MAKEAGEKALADAGIPVRPRSSRRRSATATATRPAASAPSTSSGCTGIPVYNVNNNCSTGSTALFMAKQFVEGGLADCVLALGFEKMEKGSLGAKYMDRTNPMDKQLQVMVDLRGFAARAADARSSSATPAASTWRSTARRAERVREDRPQEPQALGQQPVLAVPATSTRSTTS